MDFSLQMVTPYLTGLLVFILGFLLINMLASLIASAAVRLPYLNTKNPRTVRENTSGLVKWTGLLVLITLLMDFVGLSAAVAPIVGFFKNILEYLPRIIGSVALVVLGLFLARMAQRVTESWLMGLGLDAKLNSNMPAGNSPVSLARPLAQAVMLLVLLPFLSAVLSALSLTNMLEPVNNLLSSIIGFVPNLIGAVIIVGVGYLVANIARNLSTNAMVASFGTMRQKMNVEAFHPVLTPETANILGQVIFAIIFLPLVVQGIDVLGIETISEPTKHLVSRVVSVVPNLLAGSFFLAIAVAIAAFVKQLIQPVLDSDALKSFAERVSGTTLTEQAQHSLATTLSQAVFVTILAISASQVLQLFGLGELSQLADQLIRFGGHIVIGLVIFVVGMVLANLAVSFIRSTQGFTGTANLVANVSRGVILFLFGAMALRQMGIANEIIEVGFTLLLGAVAVAFALAVGLGGRDVAAKKLAELEQKSEAPAQHFG
jgi:Conserved TM helix